MTLVELKVNGREVAADVEPRTQLADFLRDHHDLTGTHLGCEHGVCGACTLLIDGVPSRSCIVLAAACRNAEVTTIEGLDEDQIAAELRQAFSREHALQCGYCTPGMIVSARDLVLRLDDPTEHDIRVAMSGNLCRCTGYVGIVRAVHDVVRSRRMRGVGPVQGALPGRLGPVGSGHAAPEASETVHAAAPAAEVLHAVPLPLQPDFEPQVTFDESFFVSHPPDRVWDFFANIPAVAACLPGASLTRAPADGHVEGRMRVKAGPISAEFQGVAEIRRDEATRVGTILGSGRDRRSNSTTKGMVRYQVLPGRSPDETRVLVTIGYTLSGMLAQFGRSGLARDVVDRLNAIFIRNIEMRLSGNESDDNRHAAQAAELNAVSLFLSIVTRRLKRLFGRG